MTVAELLQAIAERFADPDRWTTGAAARNAEGCTVDPGSPDARSWSLTGALSAEVASSQLRRDTRRLLNEVAQRRGYVDAGYVEPHVQAGEAGYDEMMALLADAYHEALHAP